ncbi:MAG: hypothetical protein EB127_21120 [Alphaproteobacteria bacterium]|nr:hypothetical protein [Alphaproteobacteria bacterium]
MVDIKYINNRSDGYIGKYHTRLIMGPYKRPTPFASSKFEIQKIIYLPLPTDLRDNTSVGYTDMNLESVGDVFNGDVGGTEAAALRYSGDVAAATGGIISEIAGMAANRFLGNNVGTALGRTVKGVGKVARPEQITSAIQQSLGEAPNPNPSVMFTGPELRNFSHSWTLYPKTMTETAHVKRIIEVLKQSALPENKLSGGASVLKYPNMVQINFFPWDDGSKGNPWYWSENSIIKYKKAVMKNVNVNYSPGGAPGFFHETNGPVAINISIEFMEIEYLLSGDWIASGIGTTDTAPTVSSEVAGRQSAQGASSPMANYAGPEGVPIK